MTWKPLWEDVPADKIKRSLGYWKLPKPGFDRVCAKRFLPAENSIHLSNLLESTSFCIRMKLYRTWCQQQIRTWSSDSLCRYLCACVCVCAINFCRRPGLNKRHYPDWFWNYAVRLILFFCLCFRLLRGHRVEYKSSNHLHIRVILIVYISSFESWPMLIQFSWRLSKFACPVCENECKTIKWWKLCLMQTSMLDHVWSEIDRFNLISLSETACDDTWWNEIDEILLFCESVLFLLKFTPRQWHTKCTSNPSDSSFGFVSQVLHHENT